MTATRRTVRSALALAGCIAALAPAVAGAQYLYLDSNGNGIHDAGDRLRTCPTRIDVWLNTSANRDGSPASCGFGTGALNMNHYEFVLQVLGGTVSWGPMSNLIPGFTQNLARDSRDSTLAAQYHNGWGTSSTTTPIAPGLYKVATLSATVATGSPRIEVIARHPSNGTARTSFGSECPATPEHDHMNRFGVAWSDVDGLAEALAIDTPPLTTSPGIVLPMDGAGVAITVTAGDPDADPIQTLEADLTGLPLVNDAVFLVSGLNTPAAMGNFTWNPATADSGDYKVSFKAGNCLGTDSHLTIIHVIGIVTSADGGLGQARYALSPGSPEPFHRKTEIGYSLARTGPVRIVVYSVSGRKVRTLVDETMSAGPHHAAWDGTDDRGALVSSGVYLCRLEAGAFRTARRMTLLR
ncbi:MAG TPA: FlgD immunoglobulin-like domain containing protein [Candidatus Eisenbacteria bacterium]|nr:FlgD immunoglobulin-like domain containing protein [Candidatus Eisenbacteria bacterium]